MILAVIIAFFMGIILTLAVLSAFVVDIEKEQPDLTADILDMIRQRISRYGQAIASETNEQARFVLIMKQDALADIYQDIEFLILTRKKK
jgi:vacuolar-type H+-ATPase subunit E/Vma4